MNSGSKGVHCAQRNCGLKMSQSSASSSEIASKLCGCGETLLLLKATTVKNKGRLFWRCRNWASNSHYNYFEWVNEGDSKFEGKEPESEAKEGKTVQHDEVCLEKEKVILDLLKKNEKLKRKLHEEKKSGKLLQVLFVLSWASTVVFLVCFC